MNKKSDTINNIIIIAPTEFPFSTASANLLRNFGFGLIHFGSKVHLLISRGTMYNKGKGYDKRTNNYKGIKFTYCSFISKPHNYLLKAFDVFVAIFTIPAIIIIKKIKGNIDTVIIYTGYAYQNFPVLLTCKIFKVPLYKYSVDWYNKDTIVRKWWMLPKWWMFMIELSFFDKFLNGIIVISQFLKNHYYKIGVSNEKIILIPNIIDLKLFNSVKKLNVNGKGKAFRIGYVGAAFLLNGVDDLIIAFKYVHEKYTNTELLIVGDVNGEASQLPLLKAIADENGVAEHIIFTGMVHSNAVPEYLASCDVLVMARKDTHFAKAGFPTKLGEYFAAKRPVIMTNVGDIAQYFIDGKELLIAEPDNPQSFASKIIYLIENIHERKRIAQNGYFWAKENLDYIKNSRKIFNFILKNN